MRIVDTSYHITFTDEQADPDFACVGKCKKVWWSSDLESSDTAICPMCGGSLVSSVEKVHYKILYAANRKLKFSDFKKVTQVSNEDKKSIKSFLDNGALVSNLSVVKPAFEEKAKREWCN